MEPGIDDDVEPLSDQWTTKERAPFPLWMLNFAYGVHQSKEFDEYWNRRKVLLQVREYRRQLEREPQGRQTEIVFPLNLTPTTNA